MKAPVLIRVITGGREQFRPLARQAAETATGGLEWRASSSPSTRARPPRARSCSARPGRRRRRAAGISAAFSRIRAGSSTSPRISGRRRVATVNEVLARAGRARLADRGARHHQSARDHGRLGPQDRRAPSTTPSSGRTGARPSAAPSSRARACEPLVSARTGLLLDPYFSGTKIAWILDHVAGARAARRTRRTRLRHGRFLPAVAADRRRGARDRRHQCLAHDALRHPQGRVGRRAAEALSACRRRCCRRCRIRPAISARPRRTCSARRSGSAALPATSRRRWSARPVSSPA